MEHEASDRPKPLPAAALKSFFFLSLALCLACSAFIGFLAFASTLEGDSRVGFALIDVVALWVMGLLACFRSIRILIRAQREKFRISALLLIVAVLMSLPALLCLISLLPDPSLVLLIGGGLILKPLALFPIGFMLWGWRSDLSSLARGLDDTSEPAAIAPALSTGSPKED